MGKKINVGVIGAGRIGKIHIENLLKIATKKKRKGQRQRKTVCGNTIHGDISQIYLPLEPSG